MVRNVAPWQARQVPMVTSFVSPAHNVANSAGHPDNGQRVFPFTPTVSGDYQLTYVSVVSFGGIPDATNGTSYGVTIGVGAALNDIFVVSVAQRIGPVDQGNLPEVTPGATVTLTAGQEYNMASFAGGGAIVEDAVYRWDLI